MGERCALETGKIRSGWRDQVRGGEERWGGRGGEGRGEEGRGGGGGGGAFKQ